MILAAALQGDAQQWYETGSRQLDEGAFHKAAVSLEKALVQAGKDEALKGQVFRKLAYTFNASGDQERAAQNLYEAFGAFSKAGRQDDARTRGFAEGSGWSRYSNRPFRWPTRPEIPS